MGTEEPLPAPALPGQGRSHGSGWRGWGAVGSGLTGAGAGLRGEAVEHLGGTVPMDYNRKRVVGHIPDPFDSDQTLKPPHLGKKVRL